MMAMLELFLIIVKIIFLSTIYTTAILLIIFILSRTTRIQRTKRVAELKFWLLTNLIICIFLFIFSFSYWQDTGLGDNSKIPVGYGQTIQSEDFAWTYFYPNPNKTKPNQDELIIGNYEIADPFLCAEISHQYTNRNPSYDYIVYNLKEKSMKIFFDKEEYENYALKNSLPMVKDFYDFKRHYQQYLNKDQNGRLGYYHEKANAQQKVWQ
jgi:heme/copper-type cytochrome/quinol oxidase subunit 2